MKKIIRLILIVCILLTIGVQSESEEEMANVTKVKIGNLPYDIKDSFALSLNSDNAVTVPNDSDFNDYTTPGRYKVTTIASSETISNIPYQSSGTLIVMQTTQSTLLAQFYIVNSDKNMIYYRMFIGSWGAWRFLPNDSSLDSLLKLSTDRFVDPYAGSNAVFSFDNTTIKLQVNRVIGHYKTSNGELRFIITSPSDSEYIVPHDSFAILNCETRTIEVKTFQELRDTSGLNYIIMFYNSNGNVLGPWSKYYTDQTVKRIATASDSVPEYYDSYLLEKERDINTALFGLDGDAIVFVTDHHYPSNCMHSPEIVKRICNTTGINEVILGGDYINREVYKADAALQINRVASLYEYPGVNTFRVSGNHEPNNPGDSSDETIVANQLSPEELRFPILNTFAGKVVVDENSLSYYYDNEVQKIRYIVGAVNWKSQLESNSVEWVASQLLQTPSDYSAVVIFHTILRHSSGTIMPVNSAANLISVLDAAKSNTIASFDGKTYDFRGKNVNLICALCGDMHVDGYYVTPAGVNIIATTTDSLQEEGGLSRSRDTITEQAFDVVIFNRETRKIKLIRIGAGTDREFTY